MHEAADQIRIQLDDGDHTATIYGLGRWPAVIDLTEWAVLRALLLRYLRSRVLDRERLPVRRACLASPRH